MSAAAEVFLQANARGYRDFNNYRVLPPLELEFAADLLNRIAGRLQEHIGEADQFDDVTMLAVQRALS